MILTILNTNHKMIHNLQNIIEKNVKDKDFTKKINVLYEKMKKEGNVDSVLNIYNEFGNTINVIFKNDYQGCIANFEFYKKITQLTKDSLKPCGFIAFEIGKDQAEALRKIAEENGMTAEIINDFSAHPRVAVLRNIK